MKIKKFTDSLILVFDILYSAIWGFFLAIFTLNTRNILPSFFLSGDLAKQHFYLKKEFNRLLYAWNYDYPPSEQEFLNFLSSNNNYRLAIHKEFFKRSWFLKLRYWTFKNYISSPFATSFVIENNIYHHFIYTDRFFNSYKEYLSRKDEFFDIISKLKREKMPDLDIHVYVRRKSEYRFTDILKKTEGGIYQALADWEFEKQQRLKAGTFYNETGFYTEDDFN